jgi:hypothetical protein
MKLVVGFMAAQVLTVPTAPGVRASIGGVVMTSDGRPVEGAEVTAFWEPPPLTFQPGDVPRSTTGPDGKNGTPVGATWSGEDGSFVYRRLMPMEFRLAVSALPQGLYIKEAQFGSVDALTDSILLLKPPQDPLEVVLARGAELTGTVVDASVTPIANQEVVLIPDGRPNRPDLYKTAVTDSVGRFALQGVAPGEYRIFAWEKIEGFQYFDEAFVSRYQERGSPVNVKGTARADVNVVLIP